MITPLKKTKTGYKFRVIVVTDNNSVCEMVVLCSHVNNYEDARRRALIHCSQKLTSFSRFASEEEAEYLGNSFLKDLALMS